MDIDLLIKEFEFEGKRFYPILKLFKMAMNHQYDKMPLTEEMLIENTRDMKRWRLNSGSDDGYVWLTYAVPIARNGLSNEYLNFLIYSNLDLAIYSEKPSQYTKSPRSFMDDRKYLMIHNMLDIYMCLINWGFVKDLDLKLLKNA